MPYWLLILSFIFISCTEKHEQNHLKKERSLYLKQHADQEIWWYPWSKEALQYSKKNQKLIFLSIGYSSCHWCQLMEEKVFAEPDTATTLNKYYVSIKIDREERPDLDSYFLKAQMLINKQGGWPITLILTPDLEPVFGASFVPKKEFVYILEEVQKAWDTQRTELLERGHKVQEWLNKKPTVELSYDKDHELLDNFYAQYTHSFDPIYGGKKLGNLFEPKFPVNEDMRLLLRYYFHKKVEQANKMVHLTAKSIAKSALFDHIEGGFHRYAVDRQWQRPHFEKMLYDQAAFLQLYLELYQQKEDPLLKNSIEKTISYLLSTLQSPKGGFYSSQNSVTNNQEGLYYTWQEHEIQSALTKEEFSLFNEYFFLTPQNKTLSMRRTLTKKSSFIKPEVEALTQKLKKFRKRRQPPSVDKKVITAWNGLVLSALSKVVRLWPSEPMMGILKKHFDYLLTQHKRIDGSLVRRTIGGEAQYAGILDDYATMIDALIEFYQTSFDEKYLLEAFSLQEKQNELFYDKNQKNYFFSTKRDSLLADYKTFEDSSRPAGQALSYFNLIRLSQYFLNDNYKTMAQELLDSYPDVLKQVPQAFSTILIGFDFSNFNTKELVISGSKEDCFNATHEIFQSFYPYVLFGCKIKSTQVPLFNKKEMIENKTTYYVCEKGSCQNPTNSFLEAKKSFF